MYMHRESNTQLTRTREKPSTQESILTIRPPGWYKHTKEHKIRYARRLHVRSVSFLGKSVWGRAGSANGPKLTHHAIRDLTARCEKCCCNAPPITVGAFDDSGFCFLVVNSVGASMQKVEPTHRKGWTAISGHRRQLGKPTCLWIKIDQRVQTLVLQMILDL